MSPARDGQQEESAGDMRWGGEPTCVVSVPLRWAISLWRPHRWLILPLVVLTILNAFAVAAIPLAMRDVFNLLNRQLTSETLRQAVFWLFCVGLARFVVYSTLQCLRAWVNVRLEWSVRSRLFRHIVSLGPAFHGKFRTGDVLTRLTSDIGEEKLSWFLCSGVFRALEAVCDVVIVAAAMMRLNVPLALYCLAPLPLLFLLFLKVSSRLSERFRAQQRAISTVNSQLEATFNGIRLVKACALEEARARAFSQDVEARRSADFNAVSAQVLMENVYGYSWQLTAATVLLVGGWMVIEGRITLGDFVAFNAFAMSLTLPMFDLGGFLTRGRQALVVIERLRELECFAPDVRDGRAPEVAEPAAPALAVSELSYAYPGAARDTLSGVGLALRRGTLLAVTGRVGEGKSTLLRLVLRLVDPEKGRVARGGRDLRGLSLAEAREGVGYVPQDATLYSTTILDNVRFGRPSVSEDDVWWALGMAHLEADVRRMPEGLHTHVGAHGTQLSGGQKQRLSIARALAGRPSLLLLDDCTASLDAHTEARLWETLRAALPDAAIVLVTHRTAALAHADAIVVLGDGGRLLEAGRHEELMRRNGEYATLFHRWEAEEDDEVA
ncbi:MAG: ABC transporter ATP-binding protein [Armatimonadetes bacterium]|nr:ABC transporter ATP-binding protein [Armatimonadota bacterium]